MNKTRTGGFTIGFRRGGSDWEKDFSALLKWTKNNGFGALDFESGAENLVKDALASGLRIGSVDLPEWQGMMSPDKAKRADAIAQNAESIKSGAAFGPLNHFVVMMPEKDDLPRKKTFGFVVESFSELLPVLEQSKARLVIEGYPAPGALCCTPEGYRAFFKECPSKAMGINYDPSHLIRMGIDPLRFLREFAGRVGHIHAKDTEFFPERLYELGNEQPPTLAKYFGFGGTYWRYTIPGHGVMSWVEMFKILKQNGYTGCVSVEMEDEEFNGAEDTEKTGLILSQSFLEGC